MYFLENLWSQNDNVHYFEIKQQDSQALKNPKLNKEF